jgi:TfoX/Sxy family transcriptional regulator of competence genes
VIALETDQGRARSMPPFVKSPPELIARFDAVAGRFPAAERRKMFGYPALFVGGNLVTGLFADRWMIRLGPDDLAAMLELPGGGPFEPMAGKPMKGYATVPKDVVADDAAIDDWVGRAIALGQTLPAK